MVTKKLTEEVPEETDGYWLAEVDALGRLKPGAGPGGHKPSEQKFQGVASDPTVLEITSPDPEAAPEA